MDRRTQTLSVLGLALIVLASSGGCRSPRGEVPPGRRNRPSHEPGAPAVEFSTQPPDSRGMGVDGPLGGGMGNLGPSTQQGSSGLPPYGTSGNTGFGPPGTAGLSQGMGGALGTSPPKVNMAPPGMEAPSLPPARPSTGNALDSVGGLPPGTP